MRILIVEDRKTKQLFHSVLHHIYDENEYYIFPLRVEIENIFSPKKNSYFDSREACRWVICDEENLPVGRIAAFTLNTLQDDQKDKLGGIGFFECIDDLIYAHQLFERAIKWLKDKEVEKVYGPINFGPRYQYWGLLTHNFHTSPFYGQNYHLPYYHSLFESYGFEKAYEQYIFSISAQNKLPDAYVKRAQRVFSNSAYSFKHYSSHIKDSFLDDFTSVYNLAWQHQEGFEQLSLDRCKKLFNKLKWFLDENFFWLAYFHDRPIACFLAIPDLNEKLKNQRGIINPIQLLKLIFQLDTIPHQRIIGLIFGIIPSFQKKGIEGALFSIIEKELKRQSYHEMIISWIGEFNPTMKRIISRLGATHIQTMTTFQSESFPIK